MLGAELGLIGMDAEETAIAMTSAKIRSNTFYAKCNKDVIVLYYACLYIWL